MVTIVSFAVFYRNHDQRDDCAKQISDKPRVHKHCKLLDKSWVKNCFIGMFSTRSQPQLWYRNLPLRNREPCLTLDPDKCFALSSHLDFSYFQKWRGNRDVIHRKYFDVH